MATKVEKRSCEIRASQNEEGVLVGRALSYNRVSNNAIYPGGPRERIMAGAFADSLASGADVRATFQHDPGKTLGRTSAGTLKLTDGPEGLDVRIMLDKQNTDHMNLWRSVARKDYSQMSFAFTCDDESYESGTDDQGRACQIRSVRKASLQDVAVVAYPFYDGDMTAVSARSAGTVPTTEQLRARLADIARRDRVSELGKAVLADIGLETRQGNQDWLAARGYADKDQLLSALQDELDDEYGDDSMRAIDACSDGSGRCAGTVIARDLTSDGEDFWAVDFEPDDDGDERQLTQSEVSSLRLCSPKRSVKASGTTWSSSTRALRAAIEWQQRVADRELQRRMRTAAGRY